MDHLFEGDAYQGYVVDRPYGDANLVEVYNEVCPFEPFTLCYSSSAPLKPGMCIETPKSANYKRVVKQYRVLKEVKALDTLGRVQINDVEVAFPVGFDDPSCSFYMCGWSPDVDRVLILDPSDPPKHSRCGAPQRIQDGKLYKGNIIFAARFSESATPTGSDLKRCQELVQTRWIVHKASLVEVTGSRDLIRFQDCTNNPAVARRDLELVASIWLTRLPSWKMERPQAHFPARALPVPFDVGGARDETPAPSNTSTSSQLDSEVEATQQVKQALAEMGCPVARHVAQSMSGSALAVGIHDRMTLCWMSGIGPRYVSERRLVGQWLCLYLDYPQQLTASRFERSVDPPRLIRTRFVPKKASELEVGTTFVSCVCTVDTSGYTAKVFSQHFLELVDENGVLPGDLVTGDQVIVELASKNSGRDGFELVKYHGKYRGESELVVEFPFVPDFIPSLDEWSAQLEAMKEIQIAQERAETDSPILKARRTRRPSSDRVPIFDPKGVAGLRRTSSPSPSKTPSAEKPPDSPLQSPPPRPAELREAPKLLEATEAEDATSAHLQEPVVVTREDEEDSGLPESAQEESVVDDLQVNADSELSFAAEQGEVIVDEDRVEEGNEEKKETREGSKTGMPAQTPEAQEPVGQRSASPDESTPRCASVCSGPPDRATPSEAPPRASTPPPRPPSPPFEVTIPITERKKLDTDLYAEDKVRMIMAFVANISASSDLVTLRSPLLTLNNRTVEQIFLREADADRSLLPGGRLPKLRLGDWLKLTIRPKALIDISHGDTDALIGYSHGTDRICAHFRREDIFTRFNLKQKVVGKYIRFDLSFDLSQRGTVRVWDKDMYVLYDSDQEMKVAVPIRRLLFHLDESLCANFKVHVWACYTMGFVNVDASLWLSVPDSMPIWKVDSSGYECALFAEADDHTAPGEPIEEATMSGDDRSII